MYNSIIYIFSCKMCSLLLIYFSSLWNIVPQCKIYFISSLLAIAYPLIIKTLKFICMLFNNINKYDMRVETVCKMLAKIPKVEQFIVYAL